MTEKTLLRCAAAQSVEHMISQALKSVEDEVERRAFVLFVSLYVQYTDVKIAFAELLAVMCDGVSARNTRAATLPIAERDPHFHLFTCPSVVVCHS